VARARRAALLTFIAVVSLGAGEASPGPPPAVSPGVSAQQLSRIVSARVHHTRIPVVRNSNAGKIGRALASLRPTWVTGLIRYARNQHPNRVEVRAWERITAAVRAASPGAQFDVVLNAKQYMNGRQLRAMMRRVRSRLHNDGWFFDFYSVAFRRRPRMIRTAIESAHRHGEWIGGNVFGFARRKAAMPERSDFLAIQDFRLRLRLGAVRRLSALAPIMYHLHNDPVRERGGGCSFIERLNTHERRLLLRRRARQQAAYGFRVSYPALFPECFRERGPQRTEVLYSYNAFRDPPMAATIRTLLDRYD